MDLYETLNPQELIIKLLGRLVFPRDTVKEIVVGKRQKVRPWIKAYNLCDGEHATQADIANEAKIDKSDFSKALKEWEQLGIVYLVKNEAGKVCYKALTFIEELEE